MWECHLSNLLGANTCTVRLNHLKVCSWSWGINTKLLYNKTLQHRTRHIVWKVAELGEGQVKRTLTGWSASSSVPYMRTLWEHLSNSEIFRGNHGTSSSSAENRAGLIILTPLWNICHILKSHNKEKKKNHPCLLPPSKCSQVDSASQWWSETWATE